MSDIAVLADAIRRITEGESVLDPTIVARLVNRPRHTGPLDELTEREREVLGLIAEGRSNSGIARFLVLSPRPWRPPSAGSSRSWAWTRHPIAIAACSPCSPSSVPDA